jgi:uncharacterized protein (TIGR02466 family)
MSMSTSPRANAAPEIVSLFATPLVIFDVPDAPALNKELRGVIAEREKSQSSKQKSNIGGWQSSWDMDRWGGPQDIKLLAYARNVANRTTTDPEGKSGNGPYPGHFAVTWLGNMWANINRSGHGNEFHSHPGAFWSGVYYVDDGGIDADPSLGGELEFMDPRGPLPLMNAPHLRMSGSLTAGTTEKVRPKAGRMVVFPAWLMHQVRPYYGMAERISIAFNLAV